MSQATIGFSAVNQGLAGPPEDGPFFLSNSASSGEIDTYSGRRKLYFELK